MFSKKMQASNFACSLWRYSFKTLRPSTNQTSINHKISVWYNQSLIYHVVGSILLKHCYFSQKATKFNISGIRLPVACPEINPASLFWKHPAYEMINKTWIITHEAFEVLDGFETVSPKTASKRWWSERLAFLEKNLFTMEWCRKDKNIIILKILCYRCLESAIQDI